MFRPKSTLDTLIEIGFDRLLTSGQEPTAIEGKETIRHLVLQSNGKIEIMAGSGVSASNAKELSELGVDALHFTSHQTNPEKEQLGMGVKTIPILKKLAIIGRLSIKREVVIKHNILLLCFAF